MTVTDLDNSGFFPSVILLDPSGSFVTSDSDSNTAQISQSLSFTGEYTLIVVDESSGNANPVIIYEAE